MTVSCAAGNKAAKSRHPIRCASTPRHRRLVSVPRCSREFSVATGATQIRRGRHAALYIMRYMPARSPETTQCTNSALAEIGEELRRRRKELGISAATTAEAAGMSRVTLHRVESGSPSVTVGAYMNAAAALGLQLALRKPPQLHRQPIQVEPSEEDLIRVGDYPQLQTIAWQLRADTEIPGIDALQMYERNWRHVDRDAMSDNERELVQRLADKYSRGVLLV